MARISGVEIPDNKKVFVALRYLYGIGKVTAMRIIANTGIDGDKRIKDLSEEELGRVAAHIQKNVKIEGDLKREERENIRRLIEINAYRGARHKNSLPARGQRTRTNARTRKGPKKTVGVVRDKAARKQMKDKPSSGEKR
jgi:small subunit ribosomal protein S13